jgi:hypothetical protein
MVLFVLFVLGWMARMALDGWMAGPAVLRPDRRCVADEG